MFLMEGIEPPVEIMRFELDGDPVTQGSKRAFVNQKTGRAQIIEDSHRDLKFWRGRIAETASKLMGDRPLYEVPLRVEMYFTLPRPQNLLRRPMALPAKMPDLDKIERAVGDALKNVVYTDDKLIVDNLGRKRYVGHPQARPRPGVLVIISAYGL